MTEPASVLDRSAMVGQGHSAQMQTRRVSSQSPSRVGTGMFSSPLGNLRWGRHWGSLLPFLFPDEELRPRVFF